MSRRSLAVVVVTIALLSLLGQGNVNDGPRVARSTAEQRLGVVVTEPMPYPARSHQGWRTDDLDSARRVARGLAGIDHVRVASQVRIGHALRLRVERLRVTRYCATGNRTASGTWPHVGDVATLDRSIPFGTRVRIGRRAYVVRDRIGYGSDVDIFTAGAHCAQRVAEFGVQRRVVEIEVVS